MGLAICGGFTVELPQFLLNDKPDLVGDCRTTEAVILDDGTLGAVRIEGFFADSAAKSIHDLLANGVVYERDDIGDTKRANRAAREGDLPDDPIRVAMIGDKSYDEAWEALTVFEGDWFLEQLGLWLGLPLRVLRPSTPYRLDVGDYVDPHDDYPAPEYRLSVAYNLSMFSDQYRGGATAIGLVDSVEEYDHDDFFFPLKRWALKAGEQTLRPVFNSLLLIPLSGSHAHAVRTVTDGPRYSVTTLYGACTKA